VFAFTKMNHAANVTGVAGAMSATSIWKLGRATPLLQNFEALAKWCERREKKEKEWTTTREREKGLFATCKVSRYSLGRTPRAAWRVTACGLTRDRFAGLNTGSDHEASQLGC
jgi:hypothetical protein